MNWLIIDAKILLVLWLWILAVFGFGGLIYRVSGRLFTINPLQGALWLELFVSFIFGVAFLSFVVQVLNFFMPLHASLSLCFLFIGIGFFVWIYRKLLRQWQIILSGFCAFFVVGFLSLYHDSYGDSVNYHIQIVTWIQQSPVIFGLGNVHGRLGFNGIIYNFYALSDVSQIFPNLRSFIGNEIVYFGFFFSLFLTLFTNNVSKISLFILCSGLAFPFILYWGEFRGLYCEGIGAVLGILVFALLLHVLENKSALHNPTQNSHKANSNDIGYILIVSFIIALFASLVKIANTGLLSAVIICALYLYRREIFSKTFMKYIIYLGIFSIIYALPWALKGYMTSGMIAYPAAIGYIPSLEWAVSDTQRASEVCWIMSWARDPGVNCKEVLASYAWLKKWLLMETRYFGWYFKYFVYGYWAALGLSIILLILPKSWYIIKAYKNFLILFIGAICGVIFWFVSGPDPRFGMVYLIPLFGIIHAHNLTLIQALKSKFLRISGCIFFILSFLPLGKLMHNVLTYSLVFVGVAHILNWTRSKIFFVILACLLFASAHNLYRKDLMGLFGGNSAFKDTQKIQPIFVQKKLTDLGAEIYVRSNTLKEGFESVSYEPLPTTPHFNPKIQLKTIMGRKAYINTNRE
ncbi:LIC_10190 family membrane protein [Helicobacter sp.]|uniref:LIC_10190 family membrane protein n=1 Tax=Helicobacter sp. TaxID=218 RepID=UPI0037533EE8|nr:hypothetical protein [Helicobacter sp.]